MAENVEPERPPRGSRKRAAESRPPVGKIGSARVAGAGAGAGAGAAITAEAEHGSADAATPRGSVPVGVSERDADKSVETYLKDTCETLVRRVMDEADANAMALRSQFSVYKRELTSALADKHAADAADTEAKTAKVLDMDVELVPCAGPYAKAPLRRTFVVQPRRRRVAKIGRSTGKAFTQGGVSLPEDAEVSTTHGKIDVADGMVRFTDTGSTNGSEVNGKRCDKGVPVPVTSGDELLVGASRFKITLVPHGGVALAAAGGSGAAAGAAGGVGGEGGAGSA